MDANDIRHFPLALGVHNLCRMVAGAMFALGGPERLIYGGDKRADYLMDSLIAELGETDLYETDGARRFSALFFAVDVMKAHDIDPRDVGMTIPLARPAV